jgi:hypothetical protein
MGRIIWQSENLNLKVQSHSVKFKTSHEDTKARKKYGPRKGTKRHKEMSHRGQNIRELEN